MIEFCCDYMKHAHDGDREYGSFIVYEGETPYLLSTDDSRSHPINFCPWCGKEAKWVSPFHYDNEKWDEGERHGNDTMDSLRLNIQTIEVRLQSLRQGIREQMSTVNWTQREDIEKLLQTISVALSEIRSA